MDQQFQHRDYQGRAGYAPDACTAYYVIIDPGAVPGTGTEAPDHAELVFLCERPRHRSPSEHEHSLPAGARLRWPNPPAELRPPSPADG